MVILAGKPLYPPDHLGSPHVLLFFLFTGSQSLFILELAEKAKLGLLRGPLTPASPDLEVTGSCCHTQLLMKVLGILIRSSCLHGQHFRAENRSSGSPVNLELPFSWPPTPSVRAWALPPS